MLCEFEIFGVCGICLVVCFSPVHVAFASLSCGDSKGFHVLSTSIFFAKALIEHLRLSRRFVREVVYIFRSFSITYD